MNIKREICCWKIIYIWIINMSLIYQLYGAGIHGPKPIENLGPIRTGRIPDMEYIPFVSI